MIELHQLRLFCTAAELGSFTKTAVAMGLAQPTISRVIKELEETWGGQLFYRTGRGVELSEFGQQAFGRAKSLLLTADQTSEELRAMGRLPTGVVTLAMPPSIVPVAVPELVSLLSHEMPGIRLRIIEGFSDQIKRWLAAGRIDIGIYSIYEEDVGSDDRDELTSQLVLAGPASMQLPTQLDFADLAKVPLVLPFIHNGLRTIIVEIAQRMRFSLNVLVDADSIQAQKLIVQRCGCCMIKIFNTIATAQDQEMFSTSLIVNPSIRRRVVLLTTQQRPLTRAGREVVSRLEVLLQAIHAPRKSAVAGVDLSGGGPRPMTL